MLSEGRVGRVKVGVSRSPAHDPSVDAAGGRGQSRDRSARRVGRRGRRDGILCGEEHDEEGAHDALFVVNITAGGSLKSFTENH